MPAHDYTYYHKVSKMMVTVRQVYIHEVDLSYFDGSTYRDTLDAGFLGCPRTLVRQGRDTDLSLNIAQSYVAWNGYAAYPAMERSVEPDPAIPDFAEFADVSDPHLEESDEFTHTEPRFWEKQRTEIQFRTADAGAGDILSFVWKDEIAGLTADQGTIKRV